MNRECAAELVVRGTYESAVERRQFPWSDGLLSEYMQIEQTTAPYALDLIANWISLHTH